MANPWERAWAVEDEEAKPWTRSWEVDAPDRKPAGFFSELGSAVSEGAQKTYRSARAALSTYLGAGEDVVEQSARTQEIERDSRATGLTQLKRDVQARKVADDDSLWSGIKNVAGAIIDNPRGGAQLVAEQAPNAAVALGTGFAGAKGGALIGSAFGPVGTAVGGTVGFITGLFGANTLLETGGKAIEAGQDKQFTPAERERVMREGAVKGAVITGVDAVTLGASKYVLGAANRAVEQATVRTLSDAGIDAQKAAQAIQQAQRDALQAGRGLSREALQESVEKATVEAMARQGLLKPDLVSAVQSAQKAAFDTSTTLAKRTGRGATALGLESFGEGLGEYTGELAATGEASFTDAALESVAGLATSLPELYVAKRLDQPGILTQEMSRSRPLDQASPPAPPSALQDLGTANTELSSAVDSYLRDLGQARTADEAINAAVSAASVPVAPTLPPLPTMDERLAAAESPGLLGRQLDIQRQLDQAAGLDVAPTAERPALPTLPPLPQPAAQRNMELMGQAAQAGTEFERQQALEQAKVSLPTPAPGPAARYADLTPMDARQAQQRLTVLQEQTGTPLSLEIVPHPAQKERFAIGRRELPVSAADLEMPDLRAPVAPAQAQVQIESAALAGKEVQRRAEDAPRQQMISRAMANIEARGGVASPYEAELLRSANLGQPYNSIDPNLGRPASQDQLLTAATGIPVGSEAGLGYGARTDNALTDIAQQTAQQRGELVQRNPQAAGQNIFSRVSDQDVQQRIPLERNRTPDDVSTGFAYTPELQGRKRAEPAEQAAPQADIVGTFVQQMRETNTPAARAFVQDYEAGRISPAEVQSALDIQRGLPPSSQERIEGAAAAAPAPATPTGVQVETPSARVENPALREAVELYGNRPLTQQDLTVEGATARIARAGQQAPAPQVTASGIEIAQSEDLTPRGAFRGRNEAIRAGNNLPRPTMVGGRRAASLTDADLQQTANDMGLPAITRRGAQIELLARQQTERAAAPAQPPADDVSARLQAAAAQATKPLDQPAPGRIITSGVKMSTARAAVPGSTLTVNDQGTDHQLRVVDSSTLGEPGKMIQQVARIFGKKVVVFESDTAQVDGFVRDDDDSTIYLSSKSSVSPLAVFGHELTHLIKRDSPEAYSALEAVVKANLKPEGMAGFEQDYGQGANLEELSSDLVGNRFQEADFWNGVFEDIAAKNPEQSRGIITRLAASVNKAVNAFMRVVRGQTFNADQYVKDLTAVKAAVRTAVSQYAQQRREPAMRLDAELMRQESQVDLTAGSRMPASASVAGETAEPMGITASATRAAPQPQTSEALPVPASEWKASTSDKQQAKTYAENNGIDPYLSEGQLQPPVVSAKFSVKRPYGDKDLAKGRENHPVLGLPLNANGTVTLYFPATNEEARRVAKDKRLRGATPESNRIYLTNESSGPKVADNPGNIEQPVDGANVLVQVDPELLHLDQEHSDGRKDFFIQLAEGEAFARKMAQTKLFTLDAPRDAPLSKSTSISDITEGVTKAINNYRSLALRERREALRNAREVLKREHNVGTLLGENGKLEKTRIGDYGLDYDGKSVASLGLGLASAQKINEKLSTCPQAARCEGLCLGETSGQNLLYGGDGQFRSGPRLSQYLKTEALVQHPEEFAVVLFNEIERFSRNMGKEDIQPAIRLNVTSDFPPKVFESIIRAFPGTMFYDYTKLDSRPIADNHHLTYSSTGVAQEVGGKVIGVPDRAAGNPGANWTQMVKKLNQGFNVAMAFTSRTSMPEFLKDEATGQLFRVWNGDNYDARFLDPKQDDGIGMIVGLTNKDRTGKPEDAALKYDGFFVDYDPERDGPTLLIRDQNALAEKARGPERKTIPLVQASRSRERAATDIPLAELRGRKVAMQVRVESTGETGTLTMDAGDSLTDINEREAAMQRLLECVRK